MFLFLFQKEFFFPCFGLIFVMKKKGQWLEREEIHLIISLIDSMSKTIFFFLKKDKLK